MPIIYTQKRLRPRDGREFYPTQRELVAAALDYLDIPAPSRILDPGSGAGIWGEEARKRWPNAHIVGVDKFFPVGPACYDTWWVNDFLAADIPWKFDLIIGNPPYRLDWPERFSRKSYELLKPGGTLLFLMEASFSHSQQRTNHFWPEHSPVQVIILGERPSFTGDGKTNEKEYNLYIWQKGHTGGTQMIWGFGYRGGIEKPINQVSKYRPPLPVPGPTPAVKPTPRPSHKLTAALDVINNKATWGIEQGNVMAVLRSMPDESVQCVATSPPYWGLRDYDLEPVVWGGDDGCDHVWGDWEESHNVREETTAGKSRTTDRHYGQESRRFNGNHQKHTAGQFCLKCGAWRGQLGLEPTPELYVEHMVEIFREVRRVMRPDGILWLNLGDTYYSGKGRSGHADKEYQERRMREDGHLSTPHSHIGGKGKVRPQDRSHPLLKPKDLVGIPWEVALALRNDGWWLRRDIIWWKSNCMTEAVKDRPTSSHEYIFILTKSKKYFYAYIPIREPLAESTLADKRNGSGRHTQGDNGTKYETENAPDLPSWYRAKTFVNAEDGRNKRSVWEVSTKGFKEAHFAVFPPDLVEPMILAGTSEHGCCSECGAPYKRITKKTFVPQPDVSPEQGIKGADGQKPMADENHWDGVPRGTTSIKTVGWEPTCKCGTNQVQPCVVLDPFAGAGTTLLVARQHFRRAIGIEMNQEYVEMAEKRIREDELPLFEVFGL